MRPSISWLDCMVVRAVLTALALSLGSDMSLLAIGFTATSNHCGVLHPLIELRFMPAIRLLLNGFFGLALAASRQLAFRPYVYP